MVELTKGEVKTGVDPSMNEKSNPKQSVVPLGTNDTVQSLSQRQQYYLKKATSDNTRKSYRSAVRAYENWGGLLPASEAMILRYLVDHADRLNPRTLALRLTALRQWHLLQQLPDPTDTPTVRKTLKGIQRDHGQPKKKARAFSLSEMVAMIDALAETGDLKSVRDRAFLLVGFFGAFRSQELVSIQVDHLSWESQGVAILVPRSKTDQTGQGRVKALAYGEGPLCPVAALRRWLDESSIEQGLIFRGMNRWGTVQSGRMKPASVTLILQSAAKQAGFNRVDELTSHSLRRSLATTAHRAGASFATIKRQGGWSHDGSVWEYIDEADRFEHNVVTALIGKGHEASRRR